MEFTCVPALPPNSAETCIPGFDGSSSMRVQDAFTARTSAQLLLEALVSSGGD